MTSDKKQKLLSLLVGGWFMLMATGLVQAGDLEDQMEELQRQANQQQEVTNAAAAKVESLSERMRILQAEVDTATGAYDEVKGKLDTVTSQIDDNTQLLDKTEKDLKVKNKKLQLRVRDIYINGQISYVDVLFGAKDFSDFMTRMDILKRIIKHDYNLIVQVKQEREIVLTARNQLEKDKAEAEVLVKDASEKQDLLLSKKAEQQALLDQAIYDRETSEQAYEEIMAASQQIANMIRHSQASASMGSGPVSGSGAMVWPLNGPITSEFGWRVHPIFGTSRYHSGLDIGGEYGLPIYAAAAGTVIHAGWISGYGNTVIIDHGGGVTTLYGHNESLNVGEGEFVSQGQVIAQCGSTGNSTGPHCHFEVRENGEPVSPYGYL